MATRTGKATGNHGGGSQPVAPAVKAKVRKLAREGMSRNAIARQVGVSNYSVTKICATASPPITFDRKATAAATEAVLVDLKSMRATIARGLLTDEVDKLRTMFGGKISRTSWSVTTGVVEYETPATPGELKDLAVAMGILLDKHLVLVNADSDDTDLPAVDRWLAHLEGSA